jgi:DNA-binding HxlR family transcriptional regulator
LLQGVLDQLNYPRRKEILKSLPTGISKTFEELKKETGVSTGSLHHHLEELCKANMVRADHKSRPLKYSRSPFLNRLINTVLAIDEQEKAAFDRSVTEPVAERSTFLDRAREMREMYDG